MSPDATAALRARLLALRDDALRQLAEADHLDGGLLALVGNVGAALAAIDAEPSYARARGMSTTERRAN
jgi:hypothetical protein